VQVENHGPFSGRRVISWNIDRVFMVARLVLEDAREKPGCGPRGGGLRPRDGCCQNETSQTKKQRRDSAKSEHDRPCCVTANDTRPESNRLLKRCAGPQPLALLRVGVRR